MVIVFAKTTSPYFGLAVNIAKGASLYHEAKLDKTTIHTCAFGRSSEQAARAITLLRYIESWATKQLFVAGRLVTCSVIEIQATLECFQIASHCTNSDAHCLALTDEVFSSDAQNTPGGMIIKIIMPGEPTPKVELPKPKRFIMPCKRAHAFEKINREHPASWLDQVQAITVRQELDWCPFLDLSKFRQYD